MPDPAGAASLGSRPGGRPFGSPASPLLPAGHPVAATWLGAPATPEPTVLLWFRDLDTSSPVPGSLDTLDADERARAERFRFVRDRRRFVARRSFRREVLGRYLGVPARTIRFRTTGTGRPELDGPDAISFSASHAEGLAVVAIATDGVIGVDIERRRPIPGPLDLARGLFTEREVQHLGATPAARRSEEFLRLWTRKEAYAKAFGLGVSLPFDGFDVLDDVVASSGGRISPIDGLRGFAGAVAVLPTPDPARRGAGQALGS